MKARNVLAFMSFLTLFNLYLLRANVSVAIVAMADSATVNTTINATNEFVTSTQKSQSDQFNWSYKQQGVVLGCYYYGYMATNIFGGWLSGKVGFRLVIGVALILSSIVTILQPFTANIAYELFVLLRILLGFFQGVISPSLHGAWGKWAPPNERSTMLSIQMSGGSIGSCTVLFLGGLIADTIGWEWIFYTTGGFSLLLSLVWFSIVHDSPSSHPRISAKERDYITKCLELEDHQNKKASKRTPWTKILCSLPVWAISIAKFSANWLNYTLLAMLPMYMFTIFGFNLTMSSAWSGVTYLVQWISTLSGGYLSDKVIRHTTFTIQFVRKFNTTVCLVVPAIFVVLAGYVNVAAAICLFAMAMAANSLHVSGCTANSVDIAPRFAGTVYGIANTFANIVGFLSPMIVGLILNDDDSQQKWQLVFWETAVISIAGAIFYIIFASGKKQKWAVEPETPSNDLLTES